MSQEPLPCRRVPRGALACFPPAPAPNELHTCTGTPRRHGGAAIGLGGGGTATRRGLQALSAFAAYEAEELLVEMALVKILHLETTAHVEANAAVGETDACMNPQIFARDEAMQR